MGLAVRRNLAPIGYIFISCGAPIFSGIQFYMPNDNSSSLPVIPVRKTDWKELRMLQRLYRWEYRAVFSANAYGEIWTHTHFGYTPFQKREHIRGASKIVDSLVGVLLKDRPEGGRFFIADYTAFYHPEQSEPIPFAWLEPKD
jgi:hypothetical protein